MSTVALNQKSTHGQLTCPTCRKRYQIPFAMRGKVAECRSCGNKMRVSFATSLPAKKSMATKASAIPGLRTLGNGLLLSAWGGITVFLTALVLISAGIIFPFAGSTFMRTLLFGGAVVSGLLTLAGLIMQLAVPSESNGKGWLVASISIGFGLTLLVAGLIASSIAGNPISLHPLILNAIILAASTASFVCYTKFVRKTAEFSGRPEVASSTKGLMWYHLAVPVALSAVVIVLQLSVQPTENLVQILNFVGIMGMLAGAVTNIVMIVLMCQLGTHLRRSNAK